MSDRDVDMDEMDELADQDVAAFVGTLRQAYAVDAVPTPTPALAGLFESGSIGPQRTRSVRGRALKAAIAGVVLVGGSAGLAAADVLPRTVDEKVTSVVPFLSQTTEATTPTTLAEVTSTTIDDDDDDRDDDDDDRTATTIDDDTDDDTSTTIDDSDDDDNTSTTIDDNDSDDPGDDDVDDDGGNSGSGSSNSGSGSDDD